MLTEIECDIISILKLITDKMPLTDRMAAALQRLSDQLPKPTDAIDTKADSERRAAFLEANKGPKGGNGMVAPLPPSPAPDGETRKEFLERQKRPHYRPSPPTGV
jgi:hypothetical protein